MLPEIHPQISPGYGKTKDMFSVEAKISLLQRLIEVKQELICVVRGMESAATPPEHATWIYIVSKNLSFSPN